MTTLKETNVKYTTKINSNGDKTVNIKSSNGANVTNVYDGRTNEFKYCYDHNSERVKTYQRGGNIYKYYDDDDKPKYNGYKQSYHRSYDDDKSKYNRSYDRSYGYYDNDKPRYNYNRSYGNGYNRSYNRSYNPKRYYN